MVSAEAGEASDEPPAKRARSVACSGGSPPSKAAQDAPPAPPVQDAPPAPPASAQEAPPAPPAAAPLHEPTSNGKQPVLPLLRRLLTEVNQRIAQGEKGELFSFEKLSDLQRVLAVEINDSVKLVQLRKQLTTAIQQYFRSRWHPKKPDWSDAEIARGLDRPTGNRTFQEHAVDVSALGVPYINAAMIPGLQKSRVSYIATQHPLPRTVGHFWRMVMHVRPCALVMLNGHVAAEEFEAGYELAPYWEPTSLTNDEVVLTSEGESHEEDADCTVRRLACQLEGGTQWQGPQLVVSWWRDQSEPPLDKFLQLLKLLDGMVPAGPQVVLVHCAGGIGRAGVLIAADAGARAAALGDSQMCSPDRLIGHLRQCRMNMVQTAEQYEFLHHALPLRTEQMRFCP